LGEVADDLGLIRQQHPDVALRFQRVAVEGAVESRVVVLLAVDAIVGDLQVVPAGSLP
jgi:hypothetical protein